MRPRMVQVMEPFFHKKSEVTWRASNPGMKIDAWNTDINDWRQLIAIGKLFLLPYPVRLDFLPQWTDGYTHERLSAGNLNNHARIPVYHLL
jgi:hypothetical protein